MATVSHEVDRLFPEVVVILKEETIVFDIDASALLLHLISKDIHSIVFTIKIKLDMMVMDRIWQTDSLRKFTHVGCSHQRLVTVFCQKNPILVGCQTEKALLLVKLYLIWFLIVTPGRISSSFRTTFGREHDLIPFNKVDRHILIFILAVDHSTIFHIYLQLRHIVWLRFWSLGFFLRQFINDGNIYRRTCSKDHCHK